MLTANSRDRTNRNAAARRFKRLTILALALVAFQSPVTAAESSRTDAQRSVLITLGTQGGPVPNAERSQPANALILDGKPILIDAGAGVTRQLASAKISLQQIDTVFLTHLHFDHIAGVFELLALRYAVSAPGIVTIYGPPGTESMVSGLVAAMQPTADVGYGLPGAPRIPPEAGVRVVEVSDGSSMAIGDAKVRIARNTHYSFPDGTADADRFQSLSLRFEGPDRVIVFTGDTGKSAAVEKLAQDADILVSEYIDLATVEAMIRRQNPHLSEAAMAATMRHLSAHHMSLREVGDLATRARARKLILSHGIISDDGSQREAFLKEVATTYAGDAIIANDLDRF